MTNVDHVLVLVSVYISELCCYVSILVAMAMASHIIGHEMFTDSHNELTELRSYIFHILDYEAHAVMFTIISLVMCQIS